MHKAGDCNINRLDSLGNWVFTDTCITN